MIFITLGSQKFQFNRLLKAMDEIVASGEVDEEVFAQSGYSDYKPKHYRFQHFLDREKFAEMIGKADIVITHGGTGVIIGAVKQGKKVIAVPRRAMYGEHVDDHQVQLVTQFGERNLIFVCEDCSRLGEDLKKIRQAKFGSYQSNTQAIVDSIEKYIEENI